MKGYAHDHYTMNLHLQAYAFAHQFVYGQRVLDAACGECFGTMIYSTSAKSIVAVDRDKRAISKGRQLPFWCPVKFLVKDLNVAVLPEADVCVSVETIEHLDPGGFFLRNLKVKQLVFTIPINMPDGYHTMNFCTPFDVTDYLKANGWTPTFSVLQDRDIIMRLPVGLGQFKARALVGVAER